MSLIRIEKRGTINEVDNDNFVEHLNTDFEEALPSVILAVSYTHLTLPTTPYM